MRNRLVRVPDVIYAKAQERRALLRARGIDRNLWDVIQELLNEQNRPPRAGGFSL